MVWRKSAVIDERRRFIEDWLKREFSFSDLCERFQISRKTGYKLLDRFRHEGDKAFCDRSRARLSQVHALPAAMVHKLLDLKARYPLWGPRKIRDFLIHEGFLPFPAASTIGDLFKRHGLVKPRTPRRKTPPHTQPLIHCDQPNRVWSLESPNLSESMKVFRRVFEEYGLPDAIRTDNGQPFAGLGIGGLTQLSIWWLKLGIMPERIEPAKPQQNGRHERMHRTLKDATTYPPEENLPAQQKRFDAFVKEYNEERPHQALEGHRPKDKYQHSTKQMPRTLPEVSYPKDYHLRKVRINGEIKWCGKTYLVSRLLHGDPVGLQEIDDGRAIVHFASLRLGLIDARKNKIDRL